MDGITTSGILHTELVKKASDRNVYLLWSGGNDSTILLKTILHFDIYKFCNLSVVTIPFPQQDYCMEKLHLCEKELSNRGVKMVVLRILTKMDDTIDFSAACIKCKNERRNALNQYYREVKRENDLIITGHNLSDLMSYYMELTANRLSKNTEYSFMERSLELKNRFLESYITHDNIEIYRPLIRFPRLDIKKMMDENRLEEDYMCIIEHKCTWINQRKRLLQEYFEKSGISTTYTWITNLLAQNFILPSADDYSRLPLETYLV